MAALSAGTGWLVFSALLLVVGSVSTRILVLPRAGVRDEAVDDLVAATARVGRAASVALLVGLVLALVRQVMEFRDPYAPLQEDLGLLLGSGWGHTWLWTMAVAVAGVAALWLAARGRRWAWGLAVPAVLALSAYPGLTGHAGGGDGGLRMLMLGADLLHVLAAGAWMGGLAVMLLLERRQRHAPAGGAAASLLPALVPLFSPVAMTSVGVLVVTGTLASWVQLPDLQALWSSGYGRLLLLKLAIVLVVLALGAFNFKILTPRLGHPDGPSAMRRAAAMELALGTAVLLVTAILVRTSPLGH